VVAGLVLHRAERGRDLLRLFRDIHRDAPEELGLALLYLTGPAEDDIPEHLHGEPLVAIAGMYNGPIAEGEEALREVRAFGPPEADFFAPVPYADFQCALDDPPGNRHWWTAEHLSDMSDEAIELIAARSEELPAGPAQLLIAPWGGAIARVGEDRSPLSGREASFVVHPFLAWEDPADDERMFELGRAYRSDLAPLSTGAVYGNFIGDEGRERTRAGFTARSRERLARVKAEWDPENIFHGNHNIAPAAAVA
jgi:FAD/FMN-containing dehydrogenase